MLGCWYATGRPDKLKASKRRENAYDIRREAAIPPAESRHEPGRAGRAPAGEPAGRQPLGTGRDHAGDGQSGGPGGHFRCDNRLSAPPPAGADEAGGEAAAAPGTEGLGGAFFGL